MSQPMPDLRGRVGMCCVIAAEAAIFTIFVVAYLFYIGKSVAGPTPAEVLHAPIVLTVCLLSSSLTIHAGVTALRKGNVPGFARWWLVTLALGAVFLGGTAVEWYRLIYVEGLTIHTNLFGTTYFSLVGLHAFHVTAGLAGLALGSTLAVLGYVSPFHASRTGVFSLYWHFVDVVWVVVFLVVYVAGR
jgi:cytochrome c oxidase subunit 3